MKMVETSGSPSLRARRVVGALLAVFIAAMVATSASAAEEPPRSVYVNQLEEICRPRSEATEVAMRGARSDLQAERFGVVAGKFAKATSIFGGTVKLIAAVPRPPADAAKLSKWFTELKTQQGYLSQITAQLRAEHPIKAQRLTARFIHSGNLANNTVLAFGFNYCSFKFSRYG